MKTFIEWVKLMWRQILIMLAISSLIGFILLFKIGSLTTGISQTEIDYINSVNTTDKLLANPVFLLHKLPTYLLFKIQIGSIGVYRAISAIFGISAIISCFYILREWYTERVAILGTWLFLTSAWVLHISRLALPEVSYLLLMPMLWTGIWLYTTTLRKSALITISAFTAMSFYIPGFMWLLFISVIWQRKLLKSELLAVPRAFRFICALLIIIILTPLIYASTRHPEILLNVAGLPTNLINLRSVILNLISIPMNLFVRGPIDAVRWLGNVPVLDYFSTTMFVLGLYSLRYHLKLIRVQLLTGCTVLVAMLIALGGQVTFSALIPIVYIIIACGVTFMLQQWFTVFPRNPLARGVATTVISVSVLFVSYLHLTHYFIVWPRTPATKTAFSIHTLIK